ncbi:reverse transcriptase domain-containing protein [Tanacetum coccineum]|uniref:Reverse transcriptase domain-containing protein n=1 Tax=Tanacetum coccineum TaxID=301880 RepID=A0ABQ5B9W7_9ASTR
MIVEKQLLLEMFVDESLEIVDESLNMIEDESFDMIVDESLMVEDKSLEKLVDETLKLDEEQIEFVIADHSALADLDTSINLMPYSLYASLYVNTLKPTKMSIRLANHTYQHPMGVAENKLVIVGKFMFPVDFVILEMKEDRVGDDRITFLINKAMQHSHSNDDTCFRMDVVDEVMQEELDALLNDSEPFLRYNRKEENQ